MNGLYGLTFNQLEDATLYGIEKEIAHEAYRGLPLIRTGQGASERSFYDAGSDGFTNAVLNALGLLGRFALSAHVAARLFVRRMRK